MDRSPEISYGFFRQQLDAGNIASIDLQNLKISGEFVNPPLDPSKADQTDRQGEPIKLEKKFSTTIPMIASQTLDKSIGVLDMIGEDRDIVARELLEALERAQRVEPVVENRDLHLATALWQRGEYVPPSDLGWRSGIPRAC